MVAFFSGLTASGSLKEVLLGQNEFGLGGVRSMTPFLRNSPNLTRLSLPGNESISTECFNLLLETLDGGQIKDLIAYECSIESLAALGKHALPKLRTLDLSNNEITDIPINALATLTHLRSLNLSDNDPGEGGFRAIANLLRQEDCCLEHLNIRDTGMIDADAVALADSLGSNKKLRSLRMEENHLGREGLRAFLKLLIDVSSFQRAGNSNHTLQIIMLPNSVGDNKRIKEEIKSALIDNNNTAYPIGKSKVISTMLDREKRLELSRLQGIEPLSEHRLFSDIDPILLPEALAMMAKTNDRNQLYRMMVAIAPDLVSLIDRKAMLRAALAKTEARMAVIAAEHARLDLAKSRMNGQLTSLEAGEGRKARQLSGAKRGRNTAP